MKKHFSKVVGIGLVSCLFITQGEAKNSNDLTHEEIVALVNNINNELIGKDIPALEDKIVVVDMDGNIVLEEPFASLEEQTASTDVKKVINKSSFLMEYAGDRYYIIEK